MRLVSSEQVGKGHPDKICDQISDGLLDAFLQRDKNSRVAIETLIKNQNIVVAGEVTSSAGVDVEVEIHRVLSQIGLDGNYRIFNFIDRQSPDIALGVDQGGAGDQGIMFGYATKETPERLPLAYVLATRVLESLDHPLLRSDAKAQVTMRYEDDGSKRIDTFLVSVQHANGLSQEQVKNIVHPRMVEVAKRYHMNTDFQVLVNPTGRFVVGGSFADAGVTGRKIIADTYGGFGRHGGGAFSGKDPTKVDRSAAYMARRLSKWILEMEEGAEEVEVQLAYAIGVAKPVSVAVFVNGREEAEIANIVSQVYDLTPRGIRSFLKLDSVRYLDTARFGHFTNQDLPWEHVWEKPSLAQVVPR